MGAFNWYLPGINYMGIYRVPVSHHRWCTCSEHVRVDILYKYMEIFFGLHVSALLAGGRVA
jgi:hypothetical protein